MVSRDTLIKYLEVTSNPNHHISVYLQHQLERRTCIDFMECQNIVYMYYFLYIG